jgi:hypothetical protein
MSNGSKAYEQALRCPTTRRASRTRLLWGTSRFLRAHGRLKTSLKALWFATTFSLRQAPSWGPKRLLEWPTPCSISFGFRCKWRMRMVQSPFVRILLSPRPAWVVSVLFSHITAGDGAQDTETQADQHNTSHHRSCSFRRVRTQQTAQNSSRRLRFPRACVDIPIQCCA